MPTVGTSPRSRPRAAVARGAQQVQFTELADLAVLLLHGARGQATGDFPFVQIDLAVAIQIEAPPECRRVLFPGGEQGAHVLAHAQRGARTTDGAELAQHMDFAAAEQHFLDHLVVATVAHPLLGRHHFRVVGVDAAAAAAVGDLEGA